MRFSIVVPVYNNEKTINRAIDSILMQDYDSYEVVIVNDGSTDGTMDILMDYANREKRIIVITIENKGPAQARNQGIDSATGDYLLFMDGDDMLKKDALGYLVKELDGQKTDLLIFGFTITDDKLNPLKDYGLPDSKYSDRLTLGKALPMLYQSNILNQVWNKVYRLSWLKNASIRFEHFRYAEDRLFVFEALRHAEEVQVIMKSCYLYINSGQVSLVTHYYDKKFECCCLVDQRIQDVAAYLGNLGLEAKGTWDYMFSKSIISTMVQFFHPTCPLTKHEKRLAIKDILNHPRVSRKMTLNKGVGIHTKLLCLIIRSRLVWLNSFAVWFIMKIGQRDAARFIRLKHRM